MDYRLEILAIDLGHIAENCNTPLLNHTIMFFTARSNGKRAGINPMLCTNYFVPVPTKPKSKVVEPSEPEQVANESIAGLWKEYCAVKNRIAGALGRTNNIVGELAERIVAECHGGTLLGASHPSADVLLPGGTLVQVKARMLTGPNTTSLSAIRSWNFDLLAVILLSPEGHIAFGGEIPCEEAQRHAKEVRHVNGWTITTTGAFLSDPAFRILTEDYADILRQL